MWKTFYDIRNRSGKLRSLFGFLLLSGILIATVPPFLAMPLWGDVTLYDVAAREIRNGGLHYRDVFDTNPPGFVWCLATLRSIIGPSSEMLRAVDFCIVAAECLLLGVFIRRGNLRFVSFAISISLFYPFTDEFCQIQRDIWMLLPALAASALRVQRKTGRNFFPSLFEGMFWGMAVWFKPHVIVPAAVLWIATVRKRGILADAIGQIAGGITIGGAGVTYLLATGTWAYFYDVMTNWNPEYARSLMAELPERLPWNINYFEAWDLIHMVALPLAVFEIIRGDRYGRGLAALYLGWYLQALLLQRCFPYVHLPEIMLGLAVTARRLPVGGLAVLWYVSLALMHLDPAFAEITRGNDIFARHPLTQQRIYAVWTRCLKEGSSPELRNELGEYNFAHCGTDWVAIEQVATFLRTADLHDGELICWHDGTHPLYLMLDLKPGVRYMHLGTAWAFKSKRPAIAEEVYSKHARYVVSDLRLLSNDLHEVHVPGADGKWHRLPAWVPASQRELFPWNQRIVFRSGRYVVHEIHPPLGRIHIASFDELAKEKK